MKKNDFPIYELRKHNETYSIKNYSHDFLGTVRRVLNTTPDSVDHHKKEINTCYFKNENLEIKKKKILLYLEKGKINKARKALTALSKEAGKAKKLVTHDKHRVIQSIDITIEYLAEEFALKSLLQEFIREQKKQKKSSKFNFKVVEQYNSMSEEELVEIIGQSVSRNAREVYQGAKLQILLLSKGKDIYLLKSGSETLIREQEIEVINRKDNISFGTKLFLAVKSDLYDLICNKESSPGDALFDSDKISQLIFSALTGIGITASPIIGSISALVLLYGRDKFCKNTKVSRTE